jgi:hypothetical protein
MTVPTPSLGPFRESTIERGRSADQPERPGPFLSSQHVLLVVKVRT